MFGGFDSSLVMLVFLKYLMIFFYFYFANEGLEGKYLAGRPDFFSSSKIFIYLAANPGFDARSSSTGDFVG